MFGVPVRTQDGTTKLKLSNLISIVVWLLENQENIELFNWLYLSHKAFKTADFGWSSSRVSTPSKLFMTVGVDPAAKPLILTLTCCTHVPHTLWVWILWTKICSAGYISQEIGFSLLVFEDERPVKIGRSGTISNIRYVRKYSFHTSISS